MTKTIRAYGSVSQAREIERELRGLFAEEILFECGNPDEDQVSEAVWKSDLMLCGFDPSAKDEDALVNFLGRVVRNYGAWSYLPQIVLGLPQNCAAREELLRLGASCYLPAGTVPHQVAQKAFNTWRATWWQTECQREIPVLVVNRKGIIERANPFAQRRFGPIPLVGREYMDAIEGLPGSPLPQDHPVRRTFLSSNPKEKRWGQSICVEREFRRKGPDGQAQDHDMRFFLICNPLIIPSGQLHAAAVGLFDMSRWPRIIEAENAFACADDCTELYRLIVEHGGRLGFRRVQLYELNDSDGCLHGRAAIGFIDPAHHTEFVGGFPLSAENDPSTRITLKERRCACLFVHGTGQRAQFTEYLTGPLEYVEELERQGVTRWIEAPIVIPTAGQGAQPYVWGKLSFDQGSSADQPDVRDIGDIAVFSSIVGHAIAMRHRLDQEKDWRHRIHEFSAALVTAIKPDEPILKPFVARSLQLILDAVGGDVTLYRRFDLQLPQALRLIGKPVFKDAQLKRRFKHHVPPELPESRALSGYFRHFAKDERRTKKAYVVPNPAVAMTEFIREQGKNLASATLEYLSFIQSELHIPVFRGEQIVGVIVAIAGRPNAFPSEVPTQLEQFTPAISLGIESARRHDDWLLMGQAVRRTSSLMQKLADIPLRNEEAVFAALATLLSAGQGLRWNRVFIFNCHVNRAPPHLAELVYALGGLAEERAVATHRTLQEAIRKDPRYQDLSCLLDARIRDPRPHFIDSEGEPLIHDRLYDLCIAEPHVHGQPIRIDYRESVFVADRPPMPEDSEAEETNPIAVLLRLANAADLPPEYDPLTIPVNTVLRNRWILEMNRLYPGMFDESKKLFAFLLRGNADQAREPLGVVLVDMQTPYQVDEQDMVAATRIVLRLASDLLADRYQRRRNHGGINTLAARSHGPKLSEQWRKLVDSVKDITISLRDLTESPELGATMFEERVNHLTHLVLKRFKDDRKWSKMLIDDIQAFAERMARIEGHEIAFHIEDLGAQLAEWDDYWQSKEYKDVKIRVFNTAAVKGLRVPCDPLVLRDAIGALIDNSCAESILVGRPLEVQLHAEIVKTTSNAIPRVVELIYEDSGRGIDKEERPLIMIDGYTLAKPPTDKGRGLAIISRQLLEYRGHLECKGRNDNQSGAQFVVRLGVPVNVPAISSGKTYATTSDRL